jgi:hypothetical protein
MDARPGYDLTTFNALRLELVRLNEAALADGLIAPRNGLPQLPQTERPDAEPAEGSDSPDRGKAAAQRMLAMLARDEGDDSPSVPGTPFTEAGVVRLLAHLRRRAKPRSGGSHPLAQRLNRFLTRPVSMGVRTSAGVSVERLQVAYSQLQEVEANGWNHFQSVRSARRSGAATTALAPKVIEGAANAPRAVEAEA